MNILYCVNIKQQTL